MNTPKVTVNQEQRLYVIPEGKGYTCLGFDVCRERSERMADWLGIPQHGAAVRPIEQVGTIEAYQTYQDLINLCRDRYDKTGDRCPTELTPQLIGLEGKRVEVVNCWNGIERFYVGKSTGFIPCHLAIARRNSMGGSAVIGAPFKSVRVIGTR